MTQAKLSTNILSTINKSLLLFVSNSLKSMPVILLIFILSHLTTFSQERLIGMGYNGDLVFNQIKNNPTFVAKLMTVGLPYIDDFSYIGPKPSSFFWLNTNAYINNTYSKDQPTFGMATLDGLNAKGLPYNAIPFSHGYADTLTSQRINLFPYNKSDSIYLSFFYQPQGLGQDPQPEDSLIVQFKAIGNVWKQVWAVAGQPLQPFKVAMIPIDTSMFFYSSFQFRFINKATLSGNNDHWNIDYVKVAKSRTISDTLVNDIALTRPPKGFLKNYYNMPYNQYIQDTTNEKGIQRVYLKNNSLLADNCQIACETKNITLSTVDYLNTGVSNIVTGGSDYFFDFSSPFINIAAPVGTSAMVIQNKYWLDPGAAAANVFNDTIYQKIVLSNYYATDDGSAERAYSLYGSASKLAYKFKANITDSMQYIAIHWAQLNSDVSNKLINITVWSHIDEDNSGEGDDTLAVFTLLKPDYIDSLNGFVYYPIRRLIPAGDFYIGFQQISPDFLNVGFDTNTDASSKIFYNSAGVWANTAFEGALLMRPYMGSYFANPNLNIYETKKILSCYPNPTENFLHINLDQSIDRVEIYSIAGSLVAIQKNKIIDVRELSSGYYFAKIYTNYDINPLYIKFIKK